jgi:hypothetical protein
MVVGSRSDLQIGSAIFIRYFMAAIPARPRIVNFKGLRGSLFQYNDDSQLAQSFHLPIKCIAAFRQQVLNAPLLGFPHPGLISSEFRFDLSYHQVVHRGSA